MKLTTAQKQVLRKRFYKSDFISKDHIIDWWLFQIESIEVEKCKHGHKISVYINDQMTICQDCNAIIR